MLRALMRSEGLVTLARARGSWNIAVLAWRKVALRIEIVLVLLRWPWGVLRGVPARLTVVLGKHVCDLRLHHTCLVTCP